MVLCVGRMVEEIMQVIGKASTAERLTLVLIVATVGTVLVATKCTAGARLLAGRARYCFTARVKAVLAASRKWPKGESGGEEGWVVDDVNLHFRIHYQDRSFRPPSRELV